ncbi:unnamed protein product [Gongylonema pulchrum]|uniref:DUF3276 family protein n=1 Tax=Gongylonema pulchrum TaxID=637853 RepID=A0A183ETZ4_9BILA|nr:unnamed protein product [Gongylonema pulchrum]
MCIAVAITDGTEMATFRGRILNGVQQHLPEKYRLYRAADKGQKDGVRIFELTGSADSFMRWEYDRCANDRSSRLAQAINFIGAAEAFSNDDDDDDEP